jgi:CBS-domain-containing membrane protein
VADRTGRWTLPAQRRGGDIGWDRPRADVALLAGRTDTAVTPAAQDVAAPIMTNAKGIAMRNVTVGDVMTREVITVETDAGFRQIADLLVNRGLSAVPVVDADGGVVGVVSEADLLPKLEYADRLPHHPLATRRTRTIRRKAGSDRAADLMTAPAVTIGPDASISRAARTLEAARIKRLPVVNDHGRLVGIVSRRDLVRTYVRTDTQLGVGVLEVLDALWIDPSTVTVKCAAGVVHLAGRVDRRSTAQIVATLVRSTAGVVDVIDELTFDYDDTDRRTLRQPVGAFDAMIAPSQ